MHFAYSVREKKGRGEMINYLVYHRAGVKVAS